MFLTDCPAAAAAGLLAEWANRAPRRILLTLLLTGSGCHIDVTRVGMLEWGCLIMSNYLCIWCMRAWVCVCVCLWSRSFLCWYVREIPVVLDVWLHHLQNQVCLIVHLALKAAGISWLSIPFFRQNYQTVAGSSFLKVKVSSFLCCF